MKRVCYISRAKIGLTDKDREAILEVALRNNADTQITGLLLCDGQRFLQAIEGDDDIIESCFHRIRDDNRHSDISILEDSQIEEREFGVWALTCRSSLYISAEQFREYVRQDVEHVTNMRLKAMFIGFAALVK